MCVCPCTTYIVRMCLCVCVHDVRRTYWYVPVCTVYYNIHDNTTIIVVLYRLNGKPITYVYIIYATHICYALEITILYYKYT